MQNRINWPKQMRVKLAPPGAPYPDVVRLLDDHYSAKCAQAGRPFVKIQVWGLPISLNHMYHKGGGAGFVKAGTDGAFMDRNGRWRKKGVGGQALKPQAIEWRKVALEAVQEAGIIWQPTGITAAIILLESPYWITQRRLVKEEDVDNKVKPVLDAVKLATGIPDELNWHVHALKVLSKKRKTTILLYDLGDLIEYWY